MDASLTRQLSRLADQISTIVVGKRPQIEDCIACLLAAGHQTGHAVLDLRAFAHHDRANLIDQSAKLARKG